MSKVWDFAATFAIVFLTTTVLLWMVVGDEPKGCDASSEAERER